MDDFPELIIYPPKDMEFRECIICKNPFCWNEKYPKDNCIWCEINKEEQ